MKKRRESEEQIKLVVTYSVCGGLAVILLWFCVFSLLNPQSVPTMFGEFSAVKASGVGAILLFFYMVLRLVFSPKAQQVRT